MTLIHRETKSLDNMSRLQQLGGLFLGNNGFAMNSSYCQFIEKQLG